MHRLIGTTNLKRLDPLVRLTATFFRGPEGFFASDFAAKSRVATSLTNLKVEANVVCKGQKSTPYIPDLPSVYSMPTIQQADLLSAKKAIVEHFDVPIHPYSSHSISFLGLCQDSA